jgi:hypothetical protein
MSTCCECKHFVKDPDYVPTGYLENHVDGYKYEYMCKMCLFKILATGKRITKLDVDPYDILRSDYFSEIYNTWINNKNRLETCEHILGLSSTTK